MVAVFLCSDLRSVGLSASATVVVALAANLGRQTWFSAFYRFAWLLVLVVVMNVLGDKGIRPIVLGFEIPFSLESVRKAFTVVTQISMGIALSVVLTATTTPTELIKGLLSLAQPMTKLGVPIHEASTVTYMALRFVPILQEEILNIIEAQKSRGIDFRTGGIKRRARALSSVLAPALQATLRRGDRLAAAIEARGYRSNSISSEFRTSSMGGLDYWALLFSSTVALVAVALKIL